MPKVKHKQKYLTDEELSVFCWQLSQLCRSGITWSDSAQLLLEDVSSPSLRIVLETMRDEMQFGGQLSGVLAQTELFPPHFLHMIEIGQLSGRIEQVLDALAKYYQGEASMSDAIQRAITYPAVMAALISTVFLLLVIRVLPVFSKVFQSFGTTVSSSVYWLGTSSVGKYLAIGLSCLLIFASILALILFRGNRGRNLFLKGSTAVSIARSQFSSAMALLLSSGVAIDESMERMRQLLAETPLSDAVNRCIQKMESGTAFQKALTQVGILTGLQSGILAAGLQAGHSETAMEEVAQRCRLEAENRLEQLLNRFEYALVIILCLSVGAVLLSVMLPLIGVLSAIGG